MTRYSGRTLIEQPSVTSWGQVPATGIGVVSGYGVATGTPTPSGSYTDGGFNWNRITFTASSSLVVSTAGLFDVLMISGGGGGGILTAGGGNFEGGGGGSAGQLLINTYYIPVGTYTVTIGAGSPASDSIPTFASGSGIATLGIATMAGVAGPQAWGSGVKSYHSSGASWRNGYGGNPAVTGVGAFGFSGGSSTGAGDNGGGAGTAGNGGTRTAGAGTTSTFTGTSVVYGAGGLGGGQSGTVGAAGGANTGTGGGGGIGNGAGTSGGSGFVCVRFRI